MIFFHFDPTTDKILLQEMTPCATDSGNLQNKSSDENFYVHVNWEFERHSGLVAKVLE